MPVEMSREEFEDLVDRAMESVPEEFWDMVDNLAVIVEDDPPADQPGLLGLYEGVPLTERGDYAGVLPDRVFVYRNPTLRICETPEQVAEEVEVTVVHEIAHFFGIDDERLEELGWG